MLNKNFYYIKKFSFIIKTKISTNYPKSFIMIRFVYNFFVKPFRFFFMKKIGKERLVNYGISNPEITFYVIRRSPPGSGFFSNFFFVLGHLIIAKERNFEPIVDMENYLTNYHDYTFKKRNIWENYFTQASKFELKDVYNSKNVIESDWYYPYKYLDMTRIFNGDSEFIRSLHELYSDKIPINTDVQNYLNSNVPNQFKTGGQIIGVSSRGTDYRLVEGDGIHDYQPSSFELITESLKMMDIFRESFIFLATEELSVLEEFKKVFKDRLITVNRERISEFKNYGVPETYHQMHPQGVYESTLEYILEIYLLSKCNNLICGKNNGSAAAIILNNLNYDKLLIL